MIWLMRVAYEGLMEYGKPFGTQRFLKRAPESQQKTVGGKRTGASCYRP